MTVSSRSCLVAAGVVLFGCILFAQCADMRTRRESESLYDNIYSAIAEFTANDATNLPEQKRFSRQSGGNNRNSQNFATLQSAQIPRGGRQTTDTRNVIVDGFPTGLPAGTPLGVKIALASTQDLPPGEMPPIPGVAGVDFPVLTEIPDTGFDCAGQTFPGIYADTGADCQVFYMCQPNGNYNSFLCPNGTMFNQQYFICDWWYNVDCAAAPNFYPLNEFIYQDQPEGKICTSLFCSED